MNGLPPGWYTLLSSFRLTFCVVMVLSWYPFQPLTHHSVCMMETWKGKWWRSTPTSVKGNDHLFVPALVPLLSPVAAASGHAKNVEAKETFKACTAHCRWCFCYYVGCRGISDRGTEVRYLLWTDYRSDRQRTAHRPAPMRNDRQLASSLLEQYARSQSFCIDTSAVICIERSAVWKQRYRP